MDVPVTIAIDGPAAAGKSTVARRIAETLNFIYIDTGAMYRALTLKALELEIDLRDDCSLKQLLSTTNIELKNKDKEQFVYLNGKDVTSAIRSDDVSNHVSIVAQHQGIREIMVKRQQDLAKNENVVMDGRDIGTKVLPEATCKFFLVASVEERAKRRHYENIKRGFPSDLSDIIVQIKERDEIDSKREASPLIKAKDAIEIDTTSLTIEEVVKKMLSIIKSKLQL